MSELSLLESNSIITRGRWLRRATRKKNKKHGTDLFANVSSYLVLIFTSLSRIRGTFNPCLTHFSYETPLRSAAGSSGVRFFYDSLFSFVFLQDSWRDIVFSRCADLALSFPLKSEKKRKIRDAKRFFCCLLVSTSAHVSITRQNRNKYMSKQSDIIALKRTATLCDDCVRV